MKNRVIAGDYLNYGIVLSTKGIQIATSFTNKIDINKDTIEKYEIITEEQRKSGTSAILRGSLGAAVLGPVGLLAGMGAKNKGTYQIAIQFKDGKKSLIQIDDKMYKVFIKTNF